MTQTMTDQAETPPFEDDGKTLLAIVGHMIPASARHGVPGADDPAIYADIWEPFIEHLREETG